MRRIALALIAALVLAPAAADAQLRSEQVVTGLTQPVAFVQDPSDPTIQYVVQQGGLIRVVRNGALLATPFLDVSGAISTGGERGLLGLAFPPDYGAGGRFYVNFTNPAGHTVVARFRRSPTNPLVADAASRFDLRWSTGDRFIVQPFANHNGGNLAFGPDGYLYIGMGDGGSGNDPMHLAQTPSSLLGKMLRVNVGVADSDPDGLDVPADNPFVGTAGVAPEIWSFGLRNPWRFSFDDPSLGGTGAMLIGDVGQGTWEEIDHEPAGRGGRNYGWRNREGAHDNVTSPAPAFLPLIDPVFEYSHAEGRSVTGGYVYRGAALGASFRGRYFFADFVGGRVWSVALNTAPSGDATVSDLREHTAALGGSSTLGLISSFGVDAQGELYVVSWSRGAILRIANTRVVAPIVTIDTPRNGARVRQPFLFAGWAIDRGAPTGTGINTVHVWAFPATGAAARFVGANYGASRPDVGAAFGSQFTPSGWGVRVTGLPPGGYRVVAFALVAATGRFDAVAFVDIVVQGGAFVAIDAPRHMSTVDRPFLVGGWAADPAAASGTGVDAVHVWAYPVSTPGNPVFLGAAMYGHNRPDVGAFLGSQFAPSGYNLVVSSLAPGTWDIAVFARSTVSNAFEFARVVRVIVR